MAIRIITHGLKTGTGVGGVGYILRRGLVSAAAPLSVSHAFMTNITLNKGRFSDVTMNQGQLTDITLNKGLFSNVTFLR